jgi:hypothetical protein
MIRPILFYLTLVATLGGTGAHASFLVFDDLAAWQTELANRGLVESLQTFDSFSDGPLPAFNAGGVVFNPGAESGNVSGGTLVTSGNSASLPVFGETDPTLTFDSGSISGSPLFAFGFDALFRETFTSLEVSDVLTGITRLTDPKTPFVGVVSDIPIDGMLGGEIRRIDNFRVASRRAPEPTSAALLVLGLLSAGFARRRRAR